MGGYIYRESRADKFFPQLTSVERPLELCEAYMRFCLRMTDLDAEASLVRDGDRGSPARRRLQRVGRSHRDVLLRLLHAQLPCVLGSETAAAFNGGGGGDGMVRGVDGDLGCHVEALRLGRALTELDDNWACGTHNGCLYTSGHCLKKADALQRNLKSGGGLTVLGSHAPVQAGLAVLAAHHWQRETEADGAVLRDGNTKSEDDAVVGDC